MPDLPEQQLDPQLLADIENLQLRARQLAQGALVGLHRSNRRGASIEFAEHKLYVAGDDVRHIDWRAFAKTDRYHIKQYDDETNLVLQILLDTSGSMRFSHAGRPSKASHARQVAAALAYLALRQGDAAGLQTFCAGATDILPARARGSQLLEILSRLTSTQSEKETTLAQHLHHFAQTQKRHCSVVVLTDLFDPSPNLLQSFRSLVARRHDVSVLHMLDPIELSFAYEAPAFFASLEDPRRLFVQPRTLQATYAAAMQKFVHATATALADMGVRYQRLLTSDDLGRVLTVFLRGETTP